MSNILNLTESIAQLVKTNDSQAIQFCDIYIDTINVSHGEIRKLEDPGRIGATLLQIITKKLATDNEVVHGLTLVAFWCLWKSRRFNPSNNEVRISLNMLVLINNRLIKALYELGQNESMREVPEQVKLLQKQTLAAQLSAGTLDEHSDYNHYGDVVCTFLDSRLLQ